VRVWHVEASQEVRLFTRVGSPDVHDLACSPDGRLVAASSGPGLEGLKKLGDRLSTAPRPSTSELQVGSVTDRENLLTLRGLQREPVEVALSPDGKRLATVSQRVLDRRHIQVWDTATRRELALLRGYAGEKPRVVWSAGGALLATVDEGGTAKVWEADTGQPRFSLAGAGERVSAVAFSPSGRIVVVGDPLGKLKVWDATRGKMTRVLESGSPILQVGLVEDGLLAARSADGQVRVWDLTAGAAISRFAGLDMALSPDGKTLALVGSDHQVRLRRLPAGREETLLARQRVPALPRPIPGGPGPPGVPPGTFPLPSVAALVFSGDGKHLALADPDQAITVCDLKRNRTG
jgi:WD40 repeat protein